MFNWCTEFSFKAGIPSIKMSTDLKVTFLWCIFISENLRIIQLARAWARTKNTLIHCKLHPDKLFNSSSCAHGSVVPMMRFLHQVKLAEFPKLYIWSISSISVVPFIVNDCCNTVARKEIVPHLFLFSFLDILIMFVLLKFILCHQGAKYKQ